MKEIDRCLLSAAFEKVSRDFPVTDYMQCYGFHQLKEIVRSLRRHVITFEGKRLLDVGSGPMDKAAVLAELGFNTFAVDDLGDPWHHFPGMQHRIAEFAKKSNVNFHLQRDGDYSIPFEKGSFDVVTSIAVIEHLHDSPRLIINAMVDQLRDDGILLIVMPNSVNLRKRISVVFGNTNYNPVEEMFWSIGGYRGHVREYTLQELVYICGESGLDVVESRTFEHLAQQKLPPVLRQIYMTLGLIVPGFRSGLLVVARKPSGWLPCRESRAKYYKAISAAIPAKVELMDVPISNEITAGIF